MPVDVPYLGARSTMWIVAELHLFFGALILGAPIFIVICEYLGFRGGDQRYERLARETMKMVAIAYSFTAISGGLFVFILAIFYPSFSNYIFAKFAPVWGFYGLLILVESSLMYLYWYSWDPLANRKGLHITIGVLLNIVGTVTMFLANAIAAYMLTPPEQETGLWSMINNPTWSGLNLHRFIANITFGGFIVAFFAAIMFLLSKSEEDRAFYDWMGYTGNLIGVGTLMLLPLAGYIYTKELFLYSATISTFQMADKLAPFFVMQGVIIGLIFIGVNYYMWVSIWRIEGGKRFLPYRAPTFVALFIGAALWIIPANMLPDIATPIPNGVDPAAVLIPERWATLSLMMPKALAVTAMLIFTFLTYVIYWRAIGTGKIRWGAIAPQSQYALILIPTAVIYLMGLMGAIRELTRQDWHVYLQVRDVTPYWYTTPLSYTSMMSAVATLVFFVFLAFIFWIGFLLGRKEKPA